MTIVDDNYDEKVADDSIKANAEISTGETNDVDEESTRRTRVCNILLLLVSCCFVILFTYSAVVQLNDIENSRMWFYLYVMSAVVAASFLIVKCFFQKFAMELKKPLGVIFIGMLVWSTVALIYASVNRSKAIEGGNKEGGDSDKFTDSTEKSFEVSGASLCLFSALYHMALVIGL